jgi:hypothetical protein
MRKRALVLALALAGASCNRGGDKQLAALESAYHAGVITQAEYDSRKAALVSSAALDKARDAGLLTPAEYQERKQRLSAAVPIAPAPSTPTASASITPAPAPSTGVRPENIFDSHLGLNAYNLTVPANWKFDGMYVPGSSCVQLPFPVFRMYSPDGLTEIRRLPRFDWSWSTSKFKPPTQGDCLDLKQSVTADEFIKYLIGVMQVAYVRDFPIPQQLRDQLQGNFDRSNEALAASAKQLSQLTGAKNASSEPAKQYGGLAAAIAEYRNGTFTIEEQISVKMMCAHNPINFGPEKGAHSDSCNATVRIVRAPKGQLDALLARAESERLGAAENPDWVSKYLQYQNQVAKARLDQMNRDANARMQQQHDEFERAQSVRAQQHQQFLATMQEGTQRSMARAAEAANSRHAIAQDWCDYALDRQTVTGPGGTVKISNAYSQTWTDGSGNYYQTNDPNTNPNGVLRGNWTQTTQVHGDGTAK